MFHHLTHACHILFWHSVLISLVNSLLKSYGLYPAEAVPICFSLHLSHRHLPPSRLWHKKTSNQYWPIPNLPVPVRIRNIQHRHIRRIYSCSYALQRSYCFLQKHSCVSYKRTRSITARRHLERPVTRIAKPHCLTPGKTTPRNNTSSHVSSLKVIPLHPLETRITPRPLAMFTFLWNNYVAFSHNNTTFTSDPLTL